jgi:carbamoyl-phosphate synthase large subunit
MTNNNTTKFDHIDSQIIDNIKNGNTQRLKYIFKGFGQGMTADDVSQLSQIHPWFCMKLQNFWKMSQNGEFGYFESRDLENKSEQQGIFRSAQDDSVFKDDEILKQVQDDSKKTSFNLQNSGSEFKMVDTCAGEFEAFTPFFYSTKKLPDYSSFSPKNTTLYNSNEAVDELYNSGNVNFDYLIDKAARDGRDLVLDAVIFNSFDKVFVQKRRSDRALLPNCWGIVGGHYKRSSKRQGLSSIFDNLDAIINEDTGWNLSIIRSVLEIRDWEFEGVAKRTVVFDVEVKGNLDLPKLDLNKVKGFLWIDKGDLNIFDINKSYEENLVYKVVNKALELHKTPQKVIILGSGPIRIGQGVEFDYLTVHAVRAIQKKGIKAIIINNNPETVSTDYSTSDRLYFEPLTPDFVSRIVENERSGLIGVIASFGGQTAINLAKPLENKGIKILGTSAKAIDMAEDREQTGAIMNKLGYTMPKWDITYQKSEVLEKCVKIGFPVLVRPSFVLGGEGMRIIYNESEVETYLKDYFVGIESFDKPLLIDKFLDEAVEVDVDFISDGNKTYCFIMEQLDKAGIHSGDSASVFPSQTLTREIMDKLVEMAQKIAKEFEVIGIGNLQCAIKNNEIYIIEVNPRASRTVPFVSKCLGFSLAELATDVIMGESLPEFDFDLDYYKNPLYTESLKQEVIYKEQPIRSIAPKFVGIKWPVFCTHKLPGVSPELGPLMKSTGEAMTVGMTFEEAKKKWELTSSRSNNLEDYSGAEVYKL